MSLRRVKNLYCVTMIAVSALLAVWGGALGCAAGALLLAGALPSWALIGGSWKAATLTALEQRRRVPAYQNATKKSSQCLIILILRPKLRNNLNQFIG